MGRGKPVALMSRYEILDALVEDGFELASPAAAATVSAAIQHAARNGALVWTRDHVVSTSRPRVVTRAGRIVDVETAEDRP